MMNQQPDPADQNVIAALTQRLEELQAQLATREERDRLEAAQRDRDRQQLHRRRSATRKVANEMLGYLRLTDDEVDAIHRAQARVDEARVEAVNLTRTMARRKVVEREQI